MEMDDTIFYLDEDQNLLPSLVELDNSWSV